jgi:5-formyltetrahydrofolate cyclo-ligase
MTKANLRKEYLQKRVALSDEDYFRYNRQLYELFFSCVDLSLIHVLHTFLPMAKKKEPDTWLIVDRIRREFPHIRLSIPKINVKTNQLESYYFEGLHQLSENNWGIAEPKQGNPTPTEKIDMVLVPLLAFDQQGHRIGYGKGHYDRFLSTCRHDCQRVGISFFPPLRPISAMEGHDEKLNAVITPNQFFQF